MARFVEVSVSYPIPHNWKWDSIGNYTKIKSGYPFDSEKFSDDPTGRQPLIRIRDILRESTNTFTDECCPEEYIIHAGDILIGMDGDFNVGKWNSDDALLNQRVCYIQSNSNCLLNDYLYYYLPGILKIINNATPSVTVKHLSANTLRKTQIPLPPLAEQQRIVDRIESLFAKLDEAKEKAQAVVDSFETRKAAILHKAFTGELTAKWREEHNISKTTWGEKKWGDFLQSIEAGKNWSAEGRPPEGTEFGVVKVSAVTWGEFDELESKTCVVAEQWNSKTQIHKGDFLFSRANTLQLVGNCVIVRNISKRLMLSDKILRFKFDEIAHPRFVLYFTRSRIYREQVEQLASGNQDGMRNISQKNLKLVFFPIPTVVEQIEIISILDRAFAKEQQAKEAAEAVLDEIDLMKKSILARAFRGELGTNDPNEESAVELLKRGLEKK